MPEIHQKCSYEQMLHLPQGEREHEERRSKDDCFCKQCPIYQITVLKVSFAHQTSRGGKLVGGAIVCSGEHFKIMESSREEISDELLDAEHPEQQHLHIAGSNS